MLEANNLLADVALNEWFAYFTLVPALSDLLGIIAWSVLIPTRTLINQSVSSVGGHFARGRK